MSAGAIRTEKARLRAELRSRRAAVPRDVVRARSGRLVEHLSAAVPWRDARVVAAFLGIRGEPDLRPLLAAGIAAGKLILLPRIASMNPPRLIFGELGSLDALVSGPLGITEPEPAADVGALDHAGAELVLVPGVAFDRDGARLGQGKGFYDAALSRLGEVVTVGVCFDAQVLDRGAVPVEPHDVRVGMLVTESGVFVCGPPGQETP